MAHRRHVLQHPPPGVFGITRPDGVADPLVLLDLRHDRGIEPRAEVEGPHVHGVAVAGRVGHGRDVVVLVEGLEGADTVGVDDLDAVAVEVIGVPPRCTEPGRVEVEPLADDGPLVVIEAGAVIDDDVIIGSHCAIGERARIGAGSKLSAHVTVGFDCVIGERCIFHSGVVIGADGFGFAPNRGSWEKIEQLGAVRIGDDVELGANTDRKSVV